MAGIFKAYDIRGVYGETLTDDLAFPIGRALATLLKPRRVVVGRDMRPHSDPLFRELARGLQLHGAEVLDLGLCSTPMSYFANGRLGADASVMITASHNPGAWNGFKLCREQAIPISGLSGLQDLERLVQSGAFDPPAARPGAVSSYDIAPAYVAHIRSFADIRRPLQVAIDYANAMGIYEGRVLDGLVRITPLYDQLDGTFPHHEANPLKLETLAGLQAQMGRGAYDFGLAFDGDADRVGFLDEQGRIVPMDMITALIAQDLLRGPKGPILYDLRSSWAVKEVISENGGTPLMCRVGHAFIKQQMRAANALFAGELSGHYYFRENYFTESAALAALYVANLVSRSAQPLSALLRPIQRYVASGEINSEVADPARAIERLRRHYAGGRVIELDGLSIEFADWWFNVRMSNTEPLVRLNLEARTRALMEQRRDEALALLRAP
ncbi:MAG: phosphomannomutase/phosphoglucomutase [Kiritimatiellaeota bacterium]|nr:phosphomannomutase/phosphoglucomutase [Kiritimatiellota bacterium]